MKSWAMLRNRMLADPSFLFKIGTEVRENSLKKFDKEYLVDQYDIVLNLETVK